MAKDCPVTGFKVLYPECLDCRDRPYCRDRDVFCLALLSSGDGPEGEACARLLDFVLKGKEEKRLVLFAAGGPQVMEAAGEYASRPRCRFRAFQKDKSLGRRGERARAVDVLNAASVFSDRGALIIGARDDMDTKWKAREAKERGCQVRIYDLEAKELFKEGE